MNLRSCGAASDEAPLYVCAMNVFEFFYEAGANMYFDTHAHYDDDKFERDRDELIASLPANGVTLVLNPGCDRRSSETAIELSERFSYVYAAAGWHPHDARLFDEEGGESFLAAAIKHKKVMAIGEIGYDFHYNHSPRDAQEKAFVRQMDFARDAGLPVIIHSREAYEETMKIIRRYPDLCGVFHCYSGSAEGSREILEMGWYLSFTGAVTFKNARHALETIAAIPPERLMIETDAPYLSPIPHRGERCDSRMLTLTAGKIGEVLGMDADSVAALAMTNGKRFFGIDA